MSVNPKYLKALLEVSQRGDPEWGHTGRAIEPIERWLRYIKEQTGMWVPETQQDVWDGLEFRGVPSWELDALKRVRYIQPAKEKPKAVFTQPLLKRLSQASGQPVYLLRVRPNGPYTPREDHIYLTDAVPDLDLFVEEIQAWTKAFEGLSRYPKVMATLHKHCRQVTLDPTQRGSASASWRDGEKALILRLGRTLSTSVPYLRSILIHEIGHMRADETDLSKVDLWLNRTPYGNPPYISEYAGKNAEEDFAETYRAIWLEPSALRSKAPDKYLDMRKRIAARFLKRS